MTASSGSYRLGCGPFTEGGSCATWILSYETRLSGIVVEVALEERALCLPLGDEVGCV